MARRTDGQIQVIEYCAVQTIMQDSLAIDNVLQLLWVLYKVFSNKQIFSTLRVIYAYILALYQIALAIYLEVIAGDKR